MVLCNSIEVKFQDTFQDIFVSWYHCGLMQERHNSIANAVELHLSCTNLSISCNLTQKNKRKKHWSEWLNFDLNGLTCGSCILFSLTHCYVLCLQYSGCCSWWGLRQRLWHTGQTNQDQGRGGRWFCEPESQKKFFSSPILSLQYISCNLVCDLIILFLLPFWNPLSLRI